MATIVAVGRQPIHDRVGGTVGYELLFRANPQAVAADLPTAPRPTAEQMTADVVFSALNIGLDHLVGNGLLFCNAERTVLTGELPITLPSQRTVIEILETVAVDEPVLAGCRQLKAQGYRMALDDFAWSPHAEQLLALADIVKIDIQATPASELAEVYARCRSFGGLLLAEKIETAAEYERCRSIGFDLYQGYWIGRPVVASGWALAPGHAAQLRMATALLASEPDFEELHALLRSDPGLTYQVMRLASIGRLGDSGRSIAGVRDALVLAGTRQTQNWIALLLARSVPAPAPQRITEALTRARAVELLARGIGTAASDIAFSAGLLSALNLIFDVPAEQLRSALTISDELADAAFGTGTPLAGLVRAATEFQLGAADPVGTSGVNGVDDLELERAFAGAFAWTLQVQAALDRPEPVAAAH